MREMRSVRASGPADLLALVPGFLGFHPEDSVVVMTIGEASTPFHARVDLPADRVARQVLTGHLAAVAGRHGVRTAAVIVYSDDGTLAGALVDELAACFAGRCVDLVCAVRADGERWWMLGDGDGDGDGDGGTPYDVTCHPLMAQAVVDGTVVLGSRRELAGTLVGRPGETEEVVCRLEASPRGHPGDRGHLQQEGRWLGRRVRRALDDRVRLDATDVARLLVLLRASTELRDVAWAEMTHTNAHVHVDLWRDVVRRAPAELRADPAALLGFAAWLSGDGALAWCAVEVAQESDPDHGLAALLTAALSTAVPPTAWEPFGREGLSLFQP